MRPTIALFALTLAAASASLPAIASSSQPMLRYSGAIGADTLTAAGGVDVLNVVRGINPGGRTWVLRQFKARVSADGTISARGAGLLLASGETIATRGGVTNVAVTLFCGAANATAARFNSAAVPLDTFGNFNIRGPLLEDGGTNAAVLPATCDNPMLLIRSANATTGVPGAWFAAGILSGDSDDD